MTLNNALLIGRNIGNHKIRLRQGQTEGGSLSNNHHTKTQKVDSRVNLTNNVVGIGTMQTYIPKVKASPILSVPTLSALDGFKNLNFGTKKKRTNIKLKL